MGVRGRAGGPGWLAAEVGRPARPAPAAGTFARIQLKIHATILLLFLFDNRAWVDVQIRNGDVCCPGAHSLFEYRVVISGYEHIVYMISFP